jgi:hypothetical protein
VLTKDLHEIDEVSIMEEAPVKVAIGRRFVLVRQLTVREYFYMMKSIMRLYLKYSAEFVAVYKAYKEAETEKGRWRKIANYLVVLIKIDAFRKEIMKLLNRIFPAVGRHLPFRPSYLELHATPNAIMQMLFGLYQMNIADVKKNLLTLLDSTEMRETLVSANLKSTAKENSTGKKAGSIKPRFAKQGDTLRRWKTSEA